MSLEILHLKSRVLPRRINLSGKWARNLIIAKMIPWKLLNFTVRLLGEHFVETLKLEKAFLKL